MVKLTYTFITTENFMAKTTKKPVKKPVVVVKGKPMGKGAKSC